MRIFLLLLALILTSNAYAGREPCSGKKGGVMCCEYSKFICYDGSTSKSNQDCRSYPGTKTCEQIRQEYNKKNNNK